MIDYVRHILTGQFEAALAMLNQCRRACPPEYWEGKIANSSFRYIAYHTLFFLDFYLSPNEDAFVLRDLHHRGGDERGEEESIGLSQDDTLAYVPICRQKMLAALAAETRESLEGPSGFSYRRISRGELHVYNIRHVQHHVGQLSDYLRRVDAKLSDRKTLPWIGSGWRD